MSIGVTDEQHEKKTINMMVFGKGILAEPYCQNVVQYMLQYRTSFKVNVQKGYDFK